MFSSPYTGTKNEKFLFCEVKANLQPAPYPNIDFTKEIETCHNEKAIRLYVNQE